MIRDWWNGFDLAEKFALESCAMIVKFALIASLAGCGAVVAAPSDTGYDAAIVAIADSDPDERPKLPDTLSEPDDAGAAPVVFKAERPQVQVFVTRGCPPCKEAKAALAKSTIPHFVMPKNPAWVDANGFPTFAWKVGDTWHYYTGWISLEHFQAAYNASLRDVVAVSQSPTPITEVRRVLSLLRPQPHETFVDYGCGDGRWLIEAARTYRCRAIGVEIDPEQVAKARQAVADAGLTDRVQIIEGDAVAVNVEAQVGVAYLYPDVLDSLKPKLLRLNRFATYMHPVDGVAMQQAGDAWIWQRPVPVQQRYAWYGGQAYSGRVCGNPRCSMCADIARQLGM